jgi:hypothetical protein
MSLSSFYVYIMECYVYAVNLIKNFGEVPTCRAVRARLSFWAPRHENYAYMRETDTAYFPFSFANIFHFIFYNKNIFTVDLALFLLSTAEFC